MYKCLVFIATLFVGLTPISNLRADVFNGAGFSFVDFSNNLVGVATGNITIAGDGRTIGSFDSVTMTGATHSKIGDLEIIVRNVTSGQTVTLISPPDLRSSNFNGTYTFVVDPARQTIDEATSALGDADIASGTYAISSYGGGTNNGPRTNYSMFSFLPIDGTWQLQVSDFGLGETGGITGWSINVTVVPEPNTIALLSCALLPVGWLARRRFTPKKV